jgi:hypothetical protein
MSNKALECALARARRRLRSLVESDACHSHPDVAASRPRRSSSGQPPSGRRDHVVSCRAGRSSSRTS